MTLDMFMSGAFHYTADHLEMLRRDWSKWKPTDKLFDFNREFRIQYYTNECSREQLEYIVSCEIPYCSSWASQVLAERFPLSI